MNDKLKMAIAGIVASLITVGAGLVGIDAKCDVKEAVAVAVEAPAE